MRKGNIIAGIVCAAVALYVIVTCLGYPRAEAYGTGVPGPGLWPGIIAALLLICSVGLIAGTLMMKKEDLPELPMWTPGTKRVYISMAILLVYVLPVVPQRGRLEKCGDLHRGDPCDLLCIQKFPERADRFRYVQHIGGLRYEFLS